MKSTHDIKIEFLCRVKDCVYAYLDRDDMTLEEKLNGVAFAIMSVIDGEDAFLPGFILAPDPHESETEYPSNTNANVKSNIAGTLHEFFLDMKD